MTATTRRAISVAGMVWCGVVLLFHWLAGAMHCSGDGSNCAYTQAKNGVYQGFLTDANGRPIPSKDFVVGVESLRNSGPLDLRTDAAGRYCFVWPRERAVPMADGNVPVLGWYPLNGSRPPAHCTVPEQEIPWDRSEALTSTLRYRSVLILAFAAIVLLAIGRKRELALATGLVLAATSTALCHALWF